MFFYFLLLFHVGHFAHSACMPSDDVDFYALLTPAPPLYYASGKLPEYHFLTPAPMANLIRRNLAFEIREEPFNEDELRNNIFPMYIQILSQISNIHTPYSNSQKELEEFTLKIIETSFRESFQNLQRVDTFAWIALLKNASQQNITSPYVCVFVKHIIPYVLSEQNIAKFREHHKFLSDVSSLLTPLGLHLSDKDIDHLTQKRSPSNEDMKLLQQKKESASKKERRVSKFFPGFHKKKTPSSQ